MSRRNQSSMMLSGACRRCLVGPCLTYRTGERIENFLFEIVDLFKTHGEPQQSFADAGPFSGISTHCGMCHRGRMCHKGLYPAQGFGQGNDAQAVDKSRHRVRASWEFETHDATATGLLTLGQGMVRVLGKPGIEHPRYSRSPGQQIPGWVA